MSDLNFSGINGLFVSAWTEILYLQPDCCTYSRKVDYILLVLFVNCRIVCGEILNGFIREDEGSEYFECLIQAGQRKCSLI